MLLVTPHSHRDSPMPDTLDQNPEQEEASLPISSLWLPVMEVRRHIDSARLNNLAQSLKTVGQLHRIGVRPMNHGAYELIYGERRVRAAILLGWKKIEAKVFHRIDDPNLLLAILAAENLHTEKFRAIENISLIGEFKSAGFSDDRIAAILSQPDAWVQDHLHVMNDPVARAVAEAGVLLDASNLKNFMALPPSVRNALLEAA
jgi:ParB family chromosome partitioning protein